tara:strand:+ start:531 stop:854 length:324 start_codon:yes stop_codon:yes gene_type:complete
MQSSYNALIIIIIILKFFLLFSTIRLAILKRTQPSNLNTLDTIQHRKEILSIIAEALMFILLILVFYPKRKTGYPNNGVLIYGHEKIIFFILGILGLINLNWDNIFT